MAVLFLLAGISPLRVFAAEPATSATSGASAVTREGDQVKSGDGQIAAASAERLRYDVFREVPITDVTPQGWLREFLLRQNSGLTGHRAAMSYPYDTCLWAGPFPRDVETHGQDWWRYEQTAYLTDGMLRLGLLLNDESLVRTAREGVEYVLAHPLPNGRLGYPASTLSSSQWPMAIFFRALQAEYQARHDKQLLEALHKHYLTYSPPNLAGGRSSINLEGMLWVYGLTGDKALLKLAEEGYKKGGDNSVYKRFPTNERIVVHGVTYMESAKIPAILYSYTGKKEYLDAALNAFRKLDQYDLQPDGMPSCDEYLAGKDPIKPHETCDIVDYTWSLGYLLMATGDGTWADHIERAVFNGGLGCVSKDFHNLQYFSAVNQVVATGTPLSYWPSHDTECCAGNIHRLMPNFAARMWMRGEDGSLAATLYGPSQITVPLREGPGRLTVTEATSYPFSDTITFTFATPAPTKIPFRLRVPGWCARPSIEINGKPFLGELSAGRFVVLDRTFSDGDTIVAKFPMEARLSHHEGFGVFVERGPLLFAYAVPERVEVDKHRMLGKKSPDSFPPLSLFPAGPWNYALTAQDAGDLKVLETSGGAYPFDPGQSPVAIQVPARKVKNWPLKTGRYTSPLPPPTNFQTENETETLTLVPYGSTRLRLSVFPAAK